MNRRKRFARMSALALLAVVWFSGCATLRDMQNALVNLQRLQFKLDSVAPGELAGINLANINDPARFGLQDGIKLSAAFANQSLPLSFTLNVAARNPNDGTAGRPRSAATLSSLAWTLKIDQKETIAGNIANPITVPGTGEATIIPLQIRLDLYQFFQESGFKDMLNLALAIAGQSGSAARLTLEADPVVTVAGMDLKYPGKIQIIDREFTNP